MSTIYRPRADGRLLTQQSGSGVHRGRLNRRLDTRGARKRQALKEQGEVT